MQRNMKRVLGSPLKHTWYPDTSSNFRNAPTSMFSTVAFSSVAFSMYLFLIFLYPDNHIPKLIHGATFRSGYIGVGTELWEYAVLK